MRVRRARCAEICFSCPCFQSLINCSELFGWRNAGHVWLFGQLLQRRSLLRGHPVQPLRAQLSVLRALRSQCRAGRASQVLHVPAAHGVFRELWQLQRVHVGLPPAVEPMLSGQPDRLGLKPSLRLQRLCGGRKTQHVQCYANQNSIFCSLGREHPLGCGSAKVSGMIFPRSRGRAF